MSTHFTNTTKIFTLLMLSITLFGPSCSTSSSGETFSEYYFNVEMGNDENSGTSDQAPWKSLSMLEAVELNPGDKIFLAEGQTFTEPLILDSVYGSTNNPIIISTYNSGASNENGFSFIKTEGDLYAVHILNSSFIELENLSISAGPDPNIPIIDHTSGAMRIGVFVEVSEQGVYEHIYLNNLEVKDVFYEQPGFERSSSEVSSANGTQNYGWGIRFINRVTGARLKDLQLNSVVVENVAHTGIKFTANKTGNNYGILDVKIFDSKVLRSGGPGIQLSGVFNGHISRNEVDQSGSDDDSRKWSRGSGLWTWSSSDVLIEKNRFTNAKGPGDSAGAHIDFNCNNIVLQYNLSANNAGGFCEILGNNYNCSYRYNISVNDGYRVKNQDGAFQEGKIFWLSGYNGNNNPRKGPFNSYFYNNTMYVKSDIQAKVAIDRLAEGILIANNIFHIEGGAQVVPGDQYVPETGGAISGGDVFFQNNLFLHSNSWPSSYEWQDDAPLFGDVQFSNPGGWLIEDYLPLNSALVKDKGVQIQALQGDDIGLFQGLQVTEDILGNPINGLPDIGAIEVE